MIGDRVVLAYPDDEHVLDRDQDPADEDHALHLRISPFMAADMHRLDESAAFDLRRGRTAADEL